jgi:hypothetical protein
MIFALASASASSISHRTGGNCIGAPSGPRDRIEPSSNRKPSTCISFTQKYRLSKMNFSTMG